MLISHIFSVEEIQYEKLENVDDESDQGLSLQDEIRYFSENAEITEQRGPADTTIDDIEHAETPSTIQERTESDAEQADTHLEANLSIVSDRDDMCAQNEGIECSPKSSQPSPNASNDTQTEQDELKKESDVAVSDAIEKIECAQTENDESPKTKTDDCAQTENDESVQCESDEFARTGNDECTQPQSDESTQPDSNEFARSETEESAQTENNELAMPESDESVQPEKIEMPVATEDAKHAEVENTDSDRPESHDSRNEDEARLESKDAVQNENESERLIQLNESETN